MLFRVALRVTMNREESEDVVQDTLMRLWQRRDELEGISNIESFALKIAYNRALDCNERMANKSVSLVEEKHDRIDMQQQQPDQKLVHDEQMAKIADIISSLPEKQRTIVQLRDIEGKTYKEIAEILSITESDVKVTLFRTRNKIKENFLSH